MAITVGSVYVDVLPSARRFAAEVQDQIGDQLDKVGRDIGEEIGRHIAPGIGEGVTEGVEEADTRRAARRKGKEVGEEVGEAAGDAFERAFRTSVEGALRDLPKVDVEIDTDSVDQRLGDLRARLERFFDEEGKFSLDMDGASALAELATVRAGLEALRDEAEVELQFDIDEATANLDRISAQLRRNLQDRSGSFAQTLQNALAGAIRSIPDLPFNVDDRQAQAALAVLRQDLQDFAQFTEFNIDLNSEDALAQVAAFEATLRAIVDDESIDIDVRINAKAALTQIGAVRTAVENLSEASRRAAKEATAEAEKAARDAAREVERVAKEAAQAAERASREATKAAEQAAREAEKRIGAFATRMRKEVDGAITALRDIEVTVDSSDVDREVARIRGQLVSLRDLEIGVDISAEDFERDVERIFRDLDRLRGRRIDVQVRADVEGAINSLRSFDEATRIATANANRHINRVREIGLIAALAFTPATAAVIGLSATLLAMAAPIAAVVAGIDGIKSAFVPLSDEMGALRQEVAATFEASLAPAVENIALLMPVLTEGLSGTAEAISAVATSMTEIAASAENLPVVGDVFDQMNTAIVGLSPAMGELVDNVIDLGDIGSSALISLGPLLDQVGQAWDAVIDSFLRTGVGERAVVALFQVLTSLLTLLAPLTQLGAAMFAAFGPALASVINIVADALSFVAAAFNLLPSPVQAALTALLLFRITLGLLGRNIRDFNTVATTRLVGAASAISAPFRAIGGAVQEGVSAFRQVGPEVAKVGDQLALFDRNLNAVGETTARATGRVATGLEGMSQRAVQAGARMGDTLQQRIPAAVNTAATSLSGGLSRALNSAAAQFDVLPQTAGRAMGRLRELMSFRSIGRGLDRAEEFIGGGFERGWDRAEQATVTGVQALNKGSLAVEKALGDGFERGWVAAERATNTGVDRAIAGYVRLEQAANTGIDRTLAGLTRMENGVINAGLAFGRGFDAAGDAFIRGVTTIDAGVDRVINSTARLRDIPSALSTGFQQGFAAASTAAATGSRAIVGSVDTAVRGVANAADRVGSALANVPRAFTTAFSNVASTVGRAVDTGIGHLSRFSGAVATTASSITTRLVGSITGPNGLVSVLGGPWGIAITGAIALLAVLGARQADAAGKAAEHQGNIQTLAQALRDSGGAITENIRNQELARLQTEGFGDAAKTLGLDLSTVAEIARMGGPAYDALRASLQTSAGAFDNAALSLDKYGQLTLENSEALGIQSAAAEKLLPELERMRDEYEQAMLVNQLLEEGLRRTGASMVDGVRDAAALREAVTTLGNEMATTDERADALYIALIQLSGGTLPLQQAQAELGDAIADVGKKFEEAQVAASKAGVGILDAAGNINQATAEGRELVLSLTDITEAASMNAQSAFEAAGGYQNLEAATAAASKVMEGARESFIKAAREAGLTADQAARLADEAGLIPGNVDILFSGQGIPTLLGELTDIQTRLSSMPANVPINVGVISEEARLKLEEIGALAVRMPDGTVNIIPNDKVRAELPNIIEAVRNAPPAPLGVTADPAPFRAELPGLVGEVTSAPPIPYPVTANPEPLKTALPGFGSIVSQMPPGEYPIAANPTPLEQFLPSLQGKVTGLPPAGMPVGADGAPLQQEIPGLADAVNFTKAHIRVGINPFDAELQLSFLVIQIGNATANIKVGLDTTQATTIDLPNLLNSISNQIQGQGVEGAAVATARIPVGLNSDPALLIDLPALINALALPAVPVLVPVGLNTLPALTIDLPALMNAIALAIPPRLPVGLNTLPALTIDLPALINAINLTVPPRLPVGLNTLPALAIDLPALINAINTTPPALLQVGVNILPAQEQINALVAAIAQVVAVFLVTADPTPAIDMVTQLLAAIAQSVTFITVVADVGPAAQMVDQLVAAISQIVVPITVVAVFGGFAGGLLGGEDGGVVTPRAPAPSPRPPAPPFTDPQRAARGGRGMFNPDAVLDTSRIDDLRLAMGSMVMAMAGGGVNLTPMAGGVAQVVAPNTWRVIGDRLVDDEAYIPINGSTRSQKILAMTAGRMGYGLTPMQTGAIATQQVGAFQSAGSTTQSQTSESMPVGPGGGSGDTYVFPSPPPGATAAELADEVMFRLRTSQYGGLHGGRR